MSSSSLDAPLEFTTPWIKAPIRYLVCLGRDVVVFSSSCHLIFFNHVQGTEQVYLANGKERGDGVSCLNGHKFLNFFAFVENCTNPRIFVLNYPEFTILQKIEKGFQEGCISMSFSEKDYLVTLSNVPHYCVSIWNWRSGARMMRKSVDIDSQHSIVRCCPTSMSLGIITHFRPTLHVWDMFPGYNRFYVIQHAGRMKGREMPPLQDIVWSTDSELFVLDVVGNVYCVDADHYMQLCIQVQKIESPIWRDELTYKPCFAWHREGLVLGPMIDKYMKYYVRNMNGRWLKSWQIETEPLKRVLNSVNYVLICVSMNDEILKVNQSTHQIEHVISYKSDFKSLCVVNPLGEHVVALTNSNNLLAWEAQTGERVSVKKFKDSIEVIAANPVYPYVAVGYTKGYLELVSYYNVKEPTMLTAFNLYSKPVAKIVFHPKGHLMVVGEHTHGVFFLIKGVPGETMPILSYIDYRRPIVDLCIKDSDKYYIIYMLVKHPSHRCAANRIVAKTVSKSDPEKIRKKKIALPPDLLLTQIIHANDQFYIVSFNSKEIHVVEFAKKKVFVKESVTTHHLLPSIYMQVNENIIATAGFDGIVIIHTADMSELKVAFITYHRYDLGIKEIIVDRLCRYVITVGSNGSTFCTNIANMKVDRNEYRRLNSKLLEMNFMFTRQKTLGFNIKEKSWLDLRAQRREERESRQTLKERNRIIEEFEAIQEELTQLLDENLNGPELEKIDILEFYLHTRLKKFKEEECDRECEWIRLHTKALIQEQNTVAQRLKTICWDTMHTHCKPINAIYSDYYVESYVIPPEDLQTTKFHYITLQREMEEMLRKGNTFEPWVPMSEEDVKELLAQPPSIKKKDEETRILEVLERDEEEIENERSKEKIIAYHSSTTHQFIEIDPAVYQQEECVTYGQMMYQMILMENQGCRLRQYFNKVFDEMVTFKEREMQLLTERLNRLRFILSELNNTTITIDDPPYNPLEVPESILTVEPWEVGISPYISPSEQEILDREAAERERIRLLLLADNFRELALIAMMDGVLEVRWEDTLKRDIPKPKCMLEKDPADFNEDEVRQQLDYENKVAFLNSERLRYKNMLQTEYAKLSEIVKESVKKFNVKLRDLGYTKLSVESARIEDVVMIQRMQKFFYDKSQMKAHETEIQEEILSVENKIAEMQRMVTNYNESLNEVKVAGEQIQLKDRALEKAFKREFSEFSPLVQDIATKLYKRRPKASVKAITSCALLTQLGQSCITGERTVTLSPDCLEYLKSLDILDQYIGVPNQIEEVMYKTICKHRRYKIENELRFRSNSFEIVEVETALAAYHRRLSYKKDMLQKLHVKLTKAREKRISRLHNKRLQITISHGLVEIPMHGDLTDCEKAVMIRRSDVEDINANILKAGKKKLDVMSKKMVHRQKIMLKEWEHKKMRMEIEDLEEKLHLVDKFKVTKEIQLYLKQRFKGENPEKGMLTLEQEIELIKNSYERMITERKNKCAELDEQIADYRQKNKILSKKIAAINVDVCEQQLMRNIEFEKEDKEAAKKRMKAVIKRANLVKEIQDQQKDILVLQTELELLRLKTYPTLKFKEIQ